MPQLQKAKIVMTKKSFYMLQQFNSAIYNRLTEVDDVKKNSNYNREILSHFGKVIFKYGYEKTMGISLIHRHFNLNKNEKMVSKITKHNFSWITTPSEIEESNLIPVNWQFSNKNNICGFYPTEFLLNSTEYSVENLLFQKISKDTNFLAEIAELLVKFKVTEIFGLSMLLGRLTPNIPNGKVLYEQNNHDTKTSNLTFVSTKMLSDPDAVTHWHFEKKIENGFEKFIPNNKRWCDHL